MRKILLALMMMVSVSFATCVTVGSHTSENPPSCIFYNGSYYTKPVLDFTTRGTYASNNDKSEGLVLNAGSSHFGYYFDFVPKTEFALYPTVTVSQYNYTSVSSKPPVPTCTADEKLDTATNTCVPKTVDPNNADCDPVASQFTNQTTGKCDDCMAFTSFVSRASCACNAYGSTYTPVKGIAYYSTQGQYTYKKQRATCDDGTQIFIYYDPLNNNPQDYNNTTPTDSNNTTPTDNNTTTSPTDLNGTVVPDPTQADVVKALNAIKDGQKDSNTALRELGLDLKTVNTSLKEQGYTFDAILNKIKEGNDKSDARFKLMDDEFKGQTQYRNMMGKWVDQDLKNATAQLGATVDVKTATNDVEKAVKGTTGAVNAQGDKIAGKLDDILNALKDGNGTDMSATNDLLDKIKKDTNSTASGVSKLHDDLNITNETLGKIAGFFDSNATVDTNRSGSSLTLTDMLPDGGWGWFTNNAINANFTLGSNACYCESFEFQIAGKTFLFPSPELLAKIPFNYISNMLMAFIYVLGLRSFLRS